MEGGIHEAFPDFVADMNAIDAEDDAVGTQHAAVFLDLLSKANPQQHGGLQQKAVQASAALAANPAGFDAADFGEFFDVYDEGEPVEEDLAALPKAPAPTNGDRAIWNMNQEEFRLMLAQHYNIEKKEGQVRWPVRARGPVN